MKIEAHKALQVTDIQAAKDAVVVALERDGCKVDVMSPSSLSAKRGSQLKLRAIGGMFIGIKDLPVKVSVEFTSVSGENQVDISAYDDMGFGSKVGMNDKYEKAVLDLLEVAATAVSHLISAKLSTSSSAFNSFCTNCGSPLKENSKFCSSCGQGV